MKQPFFIIGSGRCGSTFLYDLLVKHSKVALTNEARVTDLLYVFSRMATLSAFQTMDLTLWADMRLHGIVAEQYVDTLSPIVDGHAKAILLEFYREHFRDKDFTHWGDKLPDPELAYMVRGIFPETKFILLVRDPRDVYCSWLGYQRRHEERGAKMGAVVLPLDEYARYWQRLHDICLQRLPEAEIVIYEQLVADPARVMESLLRFLGLEPEPDALAPGRAAENRFHAHGSSASPGASIGRWRRELDAAQVAVFESTCGELMRRFGYEPQVR